MGKKIVATTSTSCLDYYENNYDIRTIRIKLDIDGKLYADGSEMPANDFFKLLKENPTLIPKTTQVPIGELLDFFEGLYNEGYDEVFVTTISSKLSGSYNGICQCAQILADKMKIVVYDTKTVCFNEGVFALRAAQLIDEGKEFSEIIPELDYLHKNNMIMFAVDNLSYLVKNGRLSGAAGFLGTVLKIKPLLEVLENGEIHSVQKIRTTKKALDAVSIAAKEYINGRDYFMYLVYTTDENLGYLKEQIKLNCNVENLLEVPGSPIVGCHVGPGALGVGIFLKRNKE